MDKAGEERIQAIDMRIQNLREQQSMWARAGGGGMAMKALWEIADLEMEKNDIINGTNNLGITQKEREIERLKIMRNEDTLLKKFSYNKQINQKNIELQEMVKENPTPTAAIEEKEK